MPLNEDIIIGVIGLGYVGLPAAVSFGRAGFSVIGFDINEKRIQELSDGHDRTGEVEVGDVQHRTLSYTTDLDKLADVNFYIVTVPTPIDDSHRPDLSPLFSASKSVGKVLKHGDIVVYESTVYPGATEDDCIPVLEKHSGLKSGADFTVGYSPERINPGDREHRFETIKKIVAGQDARTLSVISNVYGAVITAGIHEAPNIKTAEAAKVIENTQRDLNISLINELSMIFHRLGIDTHDVLEAAGTKWNFLNFTPGLVGGHCIGVDPYYLTHKSEQVGYYPQVILSGRRVNDGMGQYVANQCVKLLLKQDRSIDHIVTVLGISFKENVSDLRNSRVVDIIRELETYGILVQCYDPLVDKYEAKHEYGIELQELDELKPADAIIIAVAHNEFSDKGWSFISSLVKQQASCVLDLKNCLDRKHIPVGTELWRL